MPKKVLSTWMWQGFVFKSWNTTRSPRRASGEPPVLLSPTANSSECNWDDPAKDCLFHSPTLTITCTSLNWWDVSGGFYRGTAANQMSKAAPLSYQPWPPESHIANEIHVVTWCRTCAVPVLVLSTCFNMIYCLCDFPYVMANACWTQAAAFKGRLGDEERTPVQSNFNCKFCVWKTGGGSKAN